MATEQLDIDLLRFARLMRAYFRPAGLHPGPPEPHGPSGVSLTLLTRSGFAEGSAIVTQAAHDGQEWIHASIAWLNRMPEYEDLAALKDAVFGPEREAYQVFPSASRHVSIHDYALHLWGRADGRGVLPEFGAGGSI